MTCCEHQGTNCNQGRACPVRQAYIDAKAGAQHALDADQRSMTLPELLLSKGAMTGPHRSTKPVKRGPVRRFIRALLDMLMSPRAPHL